MKKVVVAILSLLYLFSSIGLTLQKEFCTGRLADLRYIQCNSKVSGNCGREKTTKRDKSYCGNENKYLKNNIDQNIPEQVFQLTSVRGVYLQTSFFEASLKNLPSISEIIFINLAPP